MTNEDDNEPTIEDVEELAQEVKERRRKWRAAMTHKVHLFAEELERQFVRMLIVGGPQTAFQAALEQFKQSMEAVIDQCDQTVHEFDKMAVNTARQIEVHKRMVHQGHALIMGLLITSNGTTTVKVSDMNRAVAEFGGLAMRKLDDDTLQVFLHKDDTLKVDGDVAVMPFSEQERMVH